jgi:hypothetical protein
LETREKSARGFHRFRTHGIEIDSMHIRTGFGRQKQGETLAKPNVQEAGPGQLNASHQVMEGLSGGVDFLRRESRFRI